MDFEQRIDQLQSLVSKYDTESFAGFLAYFIKQRPDPHLEIDFNKFESKLRDFLYIIGLNAFAENTGNEKLTISSKELGIIADRVNEIKYFNFRKDDSEYTKENVIHEMAFKSHFDNGTLSYVEQDLEKLITVFTPFKEKILNDLGFELDFLVNIYKEIELISLIKLKHNTAFFNDNELLKFNQRISAKEMSFECAFDLMPKHIQDSFLSFNEKNYASLMFTPEDLYHRLPKDSVDKFLKIFSVKPSLNLKFRYYSAESPFELAPILKLSSRSYLNLYQKQIPISIYKYLYQHVLGDKIYANKLRKHRDRSCEKKVSEIFRSFFKSDAVCFYENYQVIHNHEQDLMILYKNTAIIIETKASQLHPPMRDVDKAGIILKQDFKDSIQYGYKQCKRIEDYFFENEIFNLKDEKENILYTVNPKRFENIYSIIVTLERFGSLQTDLGLMLDIGHDVDYPWSVYIDDLEIFLSACGQNKGASISKFIEFLDLRRQMHNRIYAVDELDVCASYLGNSKLFRKNVLTLNASLMFSPFEQNFFDELYFSGRLKFNQKSLPEDYYRFGLR